MTAQWVEASAAAGAWAAPRQHLLKDPAAEASFAFNLEAAFDSAQRRLLLAGMRVNLTPGALSCHCVSLVLFWCWVAELPSCSVVGSAPVTKHSPRTLGSQSDVYAVQISTRVTVCETLCSKV